MAQFRIVRQAFFGDQLHEAGAIIDVPEGVAAPDDAEEVKASVLAQAKKAAKAATAADVAAEDALLAQAGK